MANAASATPVHKHLQPSTSSKLNPCAPPFHPVSSPIIVANLAAKQSLVDACGNVIRVKFSHPSKLVYSLGKLQIISRERPPMPPKPFVPKGHSLTLPLDPSDLENSLGERPPKSSRPSIPKFHPSTQSISPGDLGISRGERPPQPVALCFPKGHPSALPINPGGLGISLGERPPKPVRPFMPKGHSSTWSDYDFEQYISSHQCYCWEMRRWRDRKSLAYRPWSIY